MNRGESGNLDLRAAFFGFKESLQGAITEPVADPVPGVAYFGFQCRQCHEVIYIMRDPNPGEDRLTGPDPQIIHCPNCGFANSAAPASWEVYIA
jgi:hypothetical protein